MSLLLSNRAACGVRMGDGAALADALKDSEDALALNPTNWKAQIARLQALQVTCERMLQQ